IDGNRVEVHDQQLQSGRNILRRGTEIRRGETVLTAGAVLRPQEVGLLAAVGRNAVKGHPAPRGAGLSTRDETLGAPHTPGPGQIRNGNGPMLVAQVSRAGGVPKYLGIARDNPEHLRSLMTEGLRSSVLVLSGGVSAGRLDLVPGVLAELGVQAHFH